MKSFWKWWADNLKRPSTWCGLVFFLLAYSIWEDKIIFHNFLEHLTKDSNFIGLIISVVSGAFIMYKRNK